MQKQGERTGEAGVQGGVQDGPQLLQEHLPQLRRVNRLHLNAVRVTEAERHSSNNAILSLADARLPKVHSSRRLRRPLRRHAFAAPLPHAAVADDAETNR